MDDAQRLVLYEATLLRLAETGDKESGWMYAGTEHGHGIAMGLTIAGVLAADALIKSGVIDEHPVMGHSLNQSVWRRYGIWPGDG